MGVVVRGFRVVGRSRIVEEEEEVRVEVMMGSDCVRVA